MQMVGAFAEFERAMLKERTKAGLDAARKEGRIGGRPPKLKPHQQQEIVTLVKQGKKTAADAARLFGVHPATVSRLLRRTWIESSTVLSVPLLPKPQLHQRIREARPELVGGDVVVGLPEVAEGLDARGGHDAAPSTRLQRATSPASSANSRNCPGAPTTW